METREIKWELTRKAEEKKEEEQQSTTVKIQQIEVETRTEKTEKEEHEIHVTENPKEMVDQQTEPIEGISEDKGEYAAVTDLTKQEVQEKDENDRFDMLIRIMAQNYKILWCRIN